MSDFWKSYDITAAEYGAGYECYPLFGTVHLIELALSALFLLCMVWWYRRSTPRTRRHILVGITAALLADEAALLLGMACTGQWNWSYLPLHLCSINVFVCLYNTLTDRSWCKEELYALCIPGAALALLCPSVRRVPQVLAFLFGSALPIYFLNKPLHTNFYFLNNPYGNVITSTFTAWFGEKFYILGFLPAIALALVLMYAPWAAAGKKR